MTIYMLEHFRALPDPRKEGHGRKQHALMDIIVVAILATIAGADTWVEVENFGIQKKKWLQTLVPLKNGIPSHDTFLRVFSILNAEAFQKCFFAWIQTIRVIQKGEVIAIDGKSVRRSHGKGMSPIHMVSAFSTAQGLSLGQVQVAQKSNEITAIPKLLDMLMLKDCTVTTDAMGCQRAIAQKIIENKGEYTLAVKENQKKLLEDISRLFVDPTRQMHHFKTTEHAHGREEVRECSVSSDISTIRNYTQWKHLKTIACITDTRTVNGTTTVATRYFISSLKKDAQEMLRVVRAHWQIETSLHCILDIAFREDESRIRTGFAAQNFALMRKIALNLLRNEKTTKDGIKAKRLQAGWNNEYLLKVLTSWES